MAAPRSSWKGYLRVSLVSCPVRLYPASSSAEKISFNNLAPGSMARISMVPTDPTTGKAVPREELLKGYEFEKGRYVIVADEDLDKIQVESNRVIVEAMKREGKAGIGRLVLSSRERAVLLSPRGKGIMIRTLRAAEEVRTEEPYFADIEEGPLDESAIALAQQIVNQKSGEFDPRLFADRYQAALADLIKAKFFCKDTATTEVA